MAIKGVRVAILKLRIWPEAVAFAKAFFDAGKPVAAICRGRRIASWPSLKTDLRNAGAEWVNEPAVLDGNLVSSRQPDDIPQFNQAMIDLFSRARPEMRRTA